MKYLNAPLADMMRDYKEVVARIRMLPNQTVVDRVVCSQWMQDLESMVRELHVGTAHYKNDKSQKFLREVESFLRTERARRRAEELTQEKAEYHNDIRLRDHVQNLLSLGDNLRMKG